MNGRPSQVQGKQKMESFQSRVLTTLKQYYTWSLLEAVRKGECPLASITQEMTIEQKFGEVCKYHHKTLCDLVGLIYLYDANLYQMIWSSHPPPPKTTLKKAIDLVYQTG